MAGAAPRLARAGDHLGQGLDRLADQMPAGIDPPVAKVSGSRRALATAIRSAMLRIGEDAFTQTAKALTPIWAIGANP